MIRRVSFVVLVGALAACNGNGAVPDSIPDQDGVTYDLTQSRAAIANVDWMTWNRVPPGQKGTLLACAMIDGPREVTFERAPYAIATPGQEGDLEPKPRRCR